jgi:hypothetical protein
MLQTSHGKQAPAIRQRTTKPELSQLISTAQAYNPIGHGSMDSTDSTDSTAAAPWRQAALDASPATRPKPRPRLAPDRIQELNQR